MTAAVDPSLIDRLKPWQNMIPVDGPERGRLPSNLRLGTPRALFNNIPLSHHAPPIGLPVVGA
jgi:hypothetical protein